MGPNAGIDRKPTTISPRYGKIGLMVQWHGSQSIEVGRLLSLAAKRTVHG